ncbi:hypothetical protein JL2886_02640 [Phaeobacter gallaeciensis]|uniref:PepSY domain-containing protein n=1 Tax=Phaeobacter gallaeciensis TaxID=60890 RepID=A0A1B0ZTU8_9RHOB|nr:MULTISPECIES: hypothetical protein [Phaeobacter]MDF1774055.1 hypothetical protein [Pseudophaeobacter sp. bin_em_oilr2.035]MEE2633173.1 hypothetical protein [Pseudomonadota bacterium]ANP37529.1 hypothetical protein JL2886_02640 [Phaeobacter gallaeciensis]MDE4059736.1 hypothetical protein [Phaeobacter gallaeciensis]MDE4122627.1 hypothetical protein [Phaeobacter gallaeciensis]
MRRRIAHVLFVLVMLLVQPGVALADPFTDRITDQLRSQGYGEIVVTRTFLGRYRIVATTDRIEREIIVNPGTGEILRDYIEDKDDDSASSGLFSLFDRLGGEDGDSDGDDVGEDGDDDGGNGDGPGAGGHGGHGGDGQGGEGQGGSGEGGDGEGGDGDD